MRTDQKPNVTLYDATYITIALVVFLTALAAIIVWSAQPARAHSWYSGTNDPETGISCCGGTDCAPIPSSHVQIDKEAGGWRYLPTGELIPWSRVQQSHDFEFHRCVFQHNVYEDRGVGFKQGDTRCFFVPGGTM